MKRITGGKKQRPVIRHENPNLGAGAGVAYGIAGRIWESAFLVESYVHAPSTWTWDPPRTIVGAPQARTILELGSGVGTAGLTTAMALDTRQTHDLIVTDLPDVCPLLARNTRDFHREGVRVHVRPLA